MKNIMSRWLAILALSLVLLSGCSNDSSSTGTITVPPDESAIVTENTENHQPDEPLMQDIRLTSDHIENQGQSEPQTQSAPQTPQPSQLTTASASFSLAEVPAFSGNAYIAVNGNIPYFGNSDITTNSFETYAPLDSLGRCGVTYACVGQDIMPTEERGSIGQVKPTGWHTVKYDCVDGKYLYNRCHLIGFQLTGENANEENLITGTRYLNIEGMLPFENMVADYVKETNNHVLYRVTPIYEGDNLLAAGVLMEGYSVEDKGDGVTFCVFAYNAQPGVKINYATGESELESGSVNTQPKPQPEKPAMPVAPSKPTENTPAPEPQQNAPQSQCDYVLNTNTKKFHLPSCSSADDIKATNRQEYSGNRDDLIAQGYVPCKRCDP